jgi:hypothetical protein
MVLNTGLNPGLERNIWKKYRKLIALKLSAD